MQSDKQAYLFTTAVSGHPNEDEFEIEFSPIPLDEEFLENETIITKNFDELLSFLDSLEEE